MKRISIILTFLVFLIFKSVFSQTAATDAGTTPGSLDVSRTGAATYNVPIETPPGIRDIAPKVSLTYSSQGGNGLAGWGWNIAGTSTISRIAPTTYHDGFKKPVDFSSTDRYALDGQRLLSINGSYGGDGTRYVTEKHSNIKIISYGKYTSYTVYGPSYFLVIYPDGSRAWYGQTANSKSRLEWAITKWQDPQGNTINYKYATDEGILRIESIYYGSTSSSTGPNRIYFAYKNRTRVEGSYVNGLQFVRKNILDYIEVYSSNSLYRKYQIEHSKTSLNYERVESVQVTNSQGGSLEPIQFHYNDTVDGLEVLTNYNSSQIFPKISADNTNVLTGDYNGDGKLDLLSYYKNDKTKINLFTEIHKGSEIQLGWDISTGSFDEIVSGPILSHNGKMLQGQGITTIKENLSLGSPTSQITFKTFALASYGPVHQYDRVWNAPNSKVHVGCGPTDYYGAIKKEYVSGDFNGDGIMDVISLSYPYEDQNCSPVPGCARPGHITCCDCYTYGKTNSQVHFIDLDRRKTTGFVSSVGILNTPISQSDRLMAADVTGDGKTDLLHIRSGELSVYSLNDNGLITRSAWAQDPEIDLQKPILAGDFNGDGKLDLAIARQYNSSSWRFFLYNGDGFEIYSKSIIATYAANFANEDYMIQNHYIARDYNGDGKTDILRHVFESEKSGRRNEKLYLYANHTNDSGVPEFRKAGDHFFDYNVSPGMHPGIPISLDAKFANGNLEYGHISGNRIRVYGFSKNHRNDVALDKIENNGLVTTIDYHPLSPEFDSSGTTESPYIEDVAENYPYVKVNYAPGTLLVRRLEQSGSNMERYRDFYYKGAVMHAQGLGFLGFKTLHRTNWYGDNVSALWSSSRQDFLKRGATVEEWSANFRSAAPSNYAQKTTYDFTTLIDGNGVFVNVPETIAVHDALRGVTTTRSFLYDGYYNPTRISVSNGDGGSVEEFTYSNNTSSDNQFYHVGRPTLKRATGTLDGNSFFMQEEFGYNNNLLATIDRKGNGTDYVTESFYYDPYGNITGKQLSAPGLATRSETFIYSNDGRFVKTVENIAGQTAYYTTDNDGNITYVNNFMGRPTSYEYDGWGRPSKRTDYLGKTVSFYYNNLPDGGLETYSDYMEGQDSYERTNAFGWTVQTETLVLNGQWVSQSYRYDIAGRNTHTSEPYWSSGSANQWNQVVFDEYGRTIEERLFTGHTKTMTYSGLTVTINDGQKTSTLTHGASGQLKTLQDNGGSISYKYHGNGSLKEADYAGQKTLVSIDAWGRRTQLVDPSAGTYTYDYNLFGEIMEETTPKGTTEYLYNNIGLVTKKTIVGDETDLQLDFTYTEYYNQPLAITGRDKKNGRYYNYSYEYDWRRRPSKIIEGNNWAHFEKEITYDSYGRPDTEHYFSSNNNASGISSVRIRNIYEADSGILKEIRDGYNGPGLWVLNEHDQRGQATAITYGNGYERDNVYDAFGLPETVSVGNDGGNATMSALQLGYSFNAQRGVLDSRENFSLGWQENFVHDQMDRLTDISGSVERHQTYDTQGRIDVNSRIGSYQYDSSNKYRLSEIGLNADGQAHYATGALQEVTYNAFKKPVEVHTHGKGRASFEYSVLGNRSSVWYGGEQQDRSQRRYHKKYSAIMPVEIIEDKQEGKVKILTFIGGDGYNAPIVHVKNDDGQGNGYHYLHRDYLGSILAITDPNGTVLEQRQFGAWGTVDKFVDSSGGTQFGHNSLLNRGFTGHEHFFDIGLIHMNGRMYDPELGRFLSPDNFVQAPYNTQSYNRYGYVMNNPLSYIDPSGEMAEQGGIEELPLLGYLAFGALAGSHGWLDKQGVYSGINKWFNKNIKGPIDRFFDRLHGRNKKEAPPKVMNAPPVSISVDPLVRSGLDSSIFTGSGFGGVSSAIAWHHNFNIGTLRGFVAGAESTWDFVKSLTTSKGWSDLGKSFINLAKMADAFSVEGMMMRNQIGEGISDFVGRVPTMSPGELGYYAGYISEQVVEGVLFSKGAGAFGNSAKAARSSSQILNTTTRQLQAKFKHAADFGVTGSWNKAAAGRFNSAINQHINSAGIKTINGTYRGQSVIHHLNPNTGLNVISNPSGQFISGWKLNPAQLQNVLKHGGL
ncbi:colicin D domain-containing protein [Zobellia uliginosa]|uniref:colicin D domain-containing protein n=1 Tax=Zobellia uliginosa TaxID=143224 RepID=UPI0026E496BA|nr:colicin D domain-containing protein [Zobellia uliginosa]MDO6517797.1 colicin D domain-containing protein [Zobellia uliginosa]